MEHTSDRESSSRNGFAAQARAQPSIPIGANHFSLFLRELQARGIDPQRQLALLGIADPARDELARSISPGQLTAFLRLVEELSGDPDIGLRAGERMRAEDMDLIGLLIRSSPDAQSAYERCAQYGSVIQQALDLEISQFGGMLICRRSMRGAPASRTLSDYFLARTITLVRQLLGTVEPLEVRLSYAQPPVIREHTRILGTRLRFDEREDALLFPAEILSRSMPHRDPVTAEILIRHLRQLPEARAAAAPDLAERTRQAISAQLRHGRATMHDVAARLGLTERTFRRQLRSLGTSFQALLDEVRCEQALHYLRSSSCSATELSGRLGFNGAPAFYRAFRRWTGCSLREYRAELAPARSPEHGSS
jgi:AraC-like DNA-binding protein